MNSLFTRFAVIIAFLATAFGANAQSVSSTLNNRPGVLVGVEQDFTLSHSIGALPPSTFIRLKIALANPAQAANIDLSISDGTNYNDLVFDASGISESAGLPYMFVPNPGQLKVTFSAAGTYNYTISIINDATSGVIATANESVVVANPPAAPTISSTLNGQSVLTGALVPYTVNTTAGGYAGTIVKVFFKANNPAQANNYNVEFFNPMGSSWQAITLNAAGEFNFGGSGFPLADAATQFRVTFDAPGTYGYKMSLYRVSDNDTLADVIESVTVTDPQAPTIASDLDGQTVLVNAQTAYSVSTTPGDYAGTLVKVFFKADNPAQAANMDLEYFEVANSTWYPLTLNANGELDFGPGAGFPLAAASTQFRVTFDAPGTYGYKMSLYRVSDDDTLAQATESVTVVDPTASTIASTLDGQTVFTGSLTDFDVTTTAGSQAGTLVRVRIQLDNAAQAGDVTLSYETAPGSGTFNPLPLDGTGMAEFGPGTGFPLADATTAFRVTLDAPGTYDYALTVFDVANGDTLAQAFESVTAVVYEAPTISSDLDGQTVDVAAQTDFDVTTTAGSEAGTLVRVRLQLDNAAQAADVNLQYETTPGSGTYTALPLDGTGMAEFGPASGFPLADAATAFRVTFDAAGTYDYTLTVFEVAGGNTLAESEESVVVEDVVVTPVPTISSDLDGRANVTVNDTENFTVTVDADGLSGVNVRIKFTLDTPAQGNNLDLRFDNPVSGNLESLTFDASGVAYAGAVTGFPIASDDYDFTVEFLEGGTYGYTVSLVEVPAGTSLADNAEEVVVIDNSGIDNNASLVLGAFPNPTENLIQIQTGESGLGTLDVFSVTGSRVMSQTVNGAVNTVSLAQLEAGVYIIRVQQAGRISTLRVVKK